MPILKRKRTVTEHAVRIVNWGLRPFSGRLKHKTKR